MTAVLALQTKNAVIFAADSAESEYSVEGNKRYLQNVTTGHAKIFQLFENNFPVMIAFWGRRSFPGNDIQNLVLFFQVMSKNLPSSDYFINFENYSIQELAFKLKLYFENVFSKLPDNERYLENFGFLIGGFSSNSNQPEVYHVKLDLSSTSFVGPEKMDRLSAVGDGWQHVSNILDPKFDLDSKKGDRWRKKLRKALSPQKTANLLQDMLRTCISIEKTAKIKAEIDFPIFIAQITKNEGFHVEKIEK